MEDTNRWMRRVHEAHSKRSPEMWEAARQRAESARLHEASARKCKAVKGHAVRSRALASECLRQMSVSAAPEEHMAVQARWRSAQEASSRHQEERMTRMSAQVLSRQVENERSELLRDADAEEEDAMAEVAGLVGAGDVLAMAALGTEGIAPGTGGGAPRSEMSPGSGTGVEALLQQLRDEPKDEAECTAKFMLYEGYASEVEAMRGTLTKFHEDTMPTMPSAVASDMDKQVKGVDSTEAMGIPDDAREWFVFHMMRQAERNNMKMASILDGFEKKIAFLAANDQTECPVCFDAFEDSGEHSVETLSCCHKVCKECWDSWSAVMLGHPFCPLCRHEEFIGTVAARVAEVPAEE